METVKSSLSAAPPPPPTSALPLSPTSSSSNSSANNSNPTPPPSLPSIPKIPPKPSLILQETPPPTTFIQADPSSFKHVVQMLTGLPETAAAAAAATRKKTSSASPSSSSSPSSTDQPPRGHLPSFKKTSSFRLYERRQKTLRKLKLSDPSFPLGATGGFSSPLSSPAASPVPLSPSTLLDLTALSLSPVTPLISDPFAAAAAAAISAEEKAIAAKGFYLHPSTPRGGESTAPPRLLPLFPITSPRVSSPPPS